MGLSPFVIVQVQAGGHCSRLYVYINIHMIFVLFSFVQKDVRSEEQRTTTFSSLHRSAQSQGVHMIDFDEKVWMGENGSSTNR